MEDEAARDLVHLRTCNGNDEASLLRSVLEARGIQCHVQGEHHRSLMGLIGTFIELHLMVPAEQADEAARILQEAAEAPPAPPVTEPADAAPHEPAHAEHGRAAPPIGLYDTASGALVGTIDEAQLHFLIDQLEEESREDRDYYLTADTVELLERDGADPDLLALLRGALAGRGEVELRWKRG